MAERFHNVREAESLGKMLFNPVLNGEVAERRWARDGLTWK